MALHSMALATTGAAAGIDEAPAQLAALSGGHPLLGDVNLPRPQPALATLFPPDATATGRLSEAADAAAVLAPA